MWLGRDRGELIDWTTQQWVKATGQRVPCAKFGWLEGPVGKTAAIGGTFFDDLAHEHGLYVNRSGTRGLLPSLAALAGPSFDPSQVHPNVAAFYERTSDYNLESWSEWCGAFRPFGTLLALLFSRRLQQLNVPLSSLDTSRGLTSEVLHLVDPKTGDVQQTAWVRHLKRTGHVLYAGSYSITQAPGHPGPCVKVVFPLPNGNAIVVMKPEAEPQGALTLTSAGRAFGDPGFYFTVRASKDKIWVKYLRVLQESIRVYQDDDAGVRADHVLNFWGATFLRLHYHLRPLRSPAS